MSLTFLAKSLAYSWKMSLAGQVLWKRCPPHNFNRQKNVRMKTWRGRIGAGVRKANRKDLTVVLLDEGASWPVCSPATASAPRRCRCAANTWPPARASAPWSSTPATPMPARAPTAWRARATCATGGHLNMGVAPQQVLPFSTGVIMEPLPVDRIEAGLPAALADASDDHWLRAAEGIMTTDTMPKAFSARCRSVWAQDVTVTGISKGAGMIRPNMATMLGFHGHRCAVAPGLLQQLATELADGAFNRITIDGDTSTNDSFVVMATNQAGNAPVTALDSADGQALKAAMWTWRANWRRPSCATAKAPPSSSPCGRRRQAPRPRNAAWWPTPLRIRRWSRPPFLPATRTWAASWPPWATPALTTWTRPIDLYLDDVHVAVQGGRNPAYREEDGQRVMKQSEITVRVTWAAATASRHGVDLRPVHDYVSINADYRS
jgi:glutamate N-acetyltransferase/amino-acid N-acetyltransferase